METFAIETLQVDAREYYFNYVIGTRSRDIPHKKNIKDIAYRKLIIRLSLESSKLVLISKLFWLKSLLAILISMHDPYFV